MKRIIIILFVLFQSLHAFLNTDNNYEKQLTVLKNFDIPANFLKDSIFISMKEDLEIYKTKHFLQDLENGDRFVPVLQKMMREAGIPVEFLYLAMTESGFSPNASSSARASGLWQFIPSTGKMYGLVDNRFIDERKDPVKSTEAAIAYLKRLHSMFDKWYVAALAYNCGEGTVLKAIAKAGTDDINVLLDENKKYLPKESRLYIRKILMMSFISNSTGFMLDHESEYLLNRANNATFIKVEVNSGTLLQDVSDSIGISLKELKAYNPQLKQVFTPPQGSQTYLYIPQDRQIAFSQNFDRSKSGGKYDVYVAKRGDSLYKIAKKYGITTEAITQINSLKTSYIKPKSELIIPLSTHPSTQTVSSASYTIKAGDTMELVAKQYNISVSALMKANHKTEAFVKVGESIVIPKKY
ncbi:MAG: transglycosylase SLT domain-containing protein [Sulfurospirillaceae bacterium]|nr:transglycosylase SLT domain-containing protein [Sulfurospirillaceae bacterium]MDD2826619.1 transglycosylase SLT domain-containing protein [Sulfurospirillaceae bacterium]